MSDNAESSAKSLDDEPKEKPFRSQRNIHTLGCFHNETSKKVRTLHGKVHGFEA